MNYQYYEALASVLLNTALLQIVIQNTILSTVSRPPTLDLQPVALNCSTVTTIHIVAVLNCFNYST